MVVCFNLCLSPLMAEAVTKLSCLFVQVVVCTPIFLDLWNCNHICLFMLWSVFALLETIFHDFRIGWLLWSQMAFILSKIKSFSYNEFFNKNGCIWSTKKLGWYRNFDTYIDMYTEYIRCQSTIHVINVIYVIYYIFDVYNIWHLTCIYISIWVSEEALGPQECSQPC